MENNIGVGAVYENTSGQGKDAFVPEEVASHFNWGAFFWVFIWGLSYKKPITLLYILACFIPFLGGILCLGLCIWFGIKGNTWAWQARRYDSIEDFHKRQKRWVVANFVIWGISILMAATIIPSFIEKTQNLQYMVSVKKTHAFLQMAHSSNFSKGYKIPNGDSKALAEYFIRQENDDFLGINNSTVKIKGFGKEPIMLTFRGGNCKNDECKVYVDINGKEKPNKYWEKGDKKLADRYVYEIKYDGGNSYAIVPPEIDRF